MPTTTGKATDFITFSRASLATVTDSDGRIKWAPHNLLLASEQFDASAWAKAASTVTANTTVAPNGLTIADTFKEDNTTSQHQISQSLTVPIGIVTMRVYAKLGSGSRYLQMRPSGLGLGVAYANFDLSTGVVVPSGTGGTAFVSASVTPSSNGFYLCEMVVNFTSAAAGMMFQLSNGTGENTSYTGDNTSSIILWGAHLYRSDLGGMVANTSAYPMYNPTTPKNLLGFSEAFDNAAWVVTNATKTATNIVGPNGLPTALTLTKTADSQYSLRQTLSSYNPANRRLTVSAWLRGSGTCILYMDNQVNQEFTQSVTLSSTWTRVSVTGTFNSTSSNTTFGIKLANGSATTVDVAQFQLSDSASLDPYVANAFAAPTAASYHGPRLDFDPVTQAARGLLVEEQRTNLATYSEAFDDAVWAGATAGIASRTANTTAAPTGTSVADTITANNALAAHYIGRSVTWTAAVHTVSVFIKYSTQQFVQLNTWDGTTARFANFDIQNGVAGTTSNATSTITSFGNGWYRCTMTGSAAQAAASGNWVICFVNSNSASATPTYTTAGTEAFFVYGAQIEAGSFATSYIPTVASSVTRSADVASVATSAFPYSATEGTIVAAWQQLAPSVSGAFYNMIDIRSDANNRASLYVSGTSMVPTATSRASGVSDFASAFSAISVGSQNKIGMALATNNSIAACNGVLGTLDTSVAMPPLNKMNIGSDSVAAHLNGHIRQITYIPRRLTNAELQQRTA